MAGAWRDGAAMVRMLRKRVGAILKLVTFDGFIWIPFGSL
jgi:protein involved in temperature-dependent protein secretion